MAEVMDPPAADAKSKGKRYIDPPIPKVGMGADGSKGVEVEAVGMGQETKADDTSEIVIDVPAPIFKVGDRVEYWEVGNVGQKARCADVFDVFIDGKYAVNVHYPGQLVPQVCKASAKPENHCITARESNGGTGPT